MSEKKLHEDFCKWLNAHGAPYSHHRMDRESGIRKGWPDFTVLWCSAWVLIEIKVGIGRLSKAQLETIADIRKNGGLVAVCRSLKECTDAVTNSGCRDYPPFKQEFAKLKATIAAIPDPAIKDKPTQKFYVARWSGTDFVIARTIGGNYAMIRQASPADIINLPKLVA